MDTLTHALSGALLARATEPHARPGSLPRSTRMWVGFWVAAFPDSDFVLRAVDPWLYVAAHRGVTHSVLLLPLWALALAALLALLYRRRHSWRAFYGVCALALGAHIAGDVITSFGTMIFAPLSDWRAQLPFTFIIDPYFTGIIVLGLLAAAYWREQRWPARLAGAALVAYVAFQALLHSYAVDIGNDYIARHRLEQATAHALPQPFSPFHWMVVIEEPHRYQRSYISLIRREVREASAGASWFGRVNASYRPQAFAQWIEAPRYGPNPADSESAKLAARSVAFESYRRFAMFPVAEYVRRTAESTCVQFADLRFAIVERNPPFNYLVCRDGSGKETAKLLD